MCAGRVLKRTALQHKMQNFTYVNVFELGRYTTRFVSLSLYVVLIKKSTT